ncbi:MAG: squalene/phytoene synthase family protein [Verrucomicrobiota bacterium]
MSDLTANEIVRRSGSNLAYALALLPVGKRHDMEVFYAFCRVVDDLADDDNSPEAPRLEALNRWRKIIDSQIKPDSILEQQVSSLLPSYPFDLSHFHAIIDGVESDFSPSDYQTQEDLRLYCFQVASAVGLISIEIFGYTQPETKIYAEKLGYALQTTNIMRDVREDAERGRIYLPQDALDEFNVPRESLLTLTPEHRPFSQLMTHQSGIARGYYSAALENLNPKDRSAMRSPELMRRIYYGIHQKMESDNFHVFEKRYRLRKTRMLAEFLRAKMGV